MNSSDTTEFYILMIILIFINLVIFLWILFVDNTKKNFHSSKVTAILRIIQLLIIAYIFYNFKVKNLLPLFLLYYYTIKKILGLGLYFEIDRYIFKDENDRDKFLNIIDGPMRYTAILSWIASAYFIFYIFFMR